MVPEKLWQKGHLKLLTREMFWATPKIPYPCRLVKLSPGFSKMVLARLLPSVSDPPPVSVTIASERECWLYFVRRVLRHESFSAEQTIRETQSRISMGVLLFRKCLTPRAKTDFGFPMLRFTFRWFRMTHFTFF